MKVEDYKKYYLTKKCEIVHCLQTEEICDSLFEKLLVIFPDKLIEFQNQKELLKIAAGLHDIGSFVENELEISHNKIGAELILSGGIEGLDDMQTLIVAALVRYHRGKSPKEKHKIFSKLDIEAKRVVLHFAPILRIADVLEDEDFELTFDGKKLLLKTDRSLSREFCTAYIKKKRLFEEVFEVEIEATVRHLKAI